MDNSKLIEVHGAKELFEKYRNISKTLSTTMIRFLREDAVDNIEEAIRFNFDDQSDSGGKWRSLSPRTVLERMTLGYPPTRPINIRTGEILREAIGKRAGTRVVKHDSQGSTLHARLVTRKAVELLRWKRNFVDYRESYARRLRTSLSETVFSLLEGK